MPLQKRGASDRTAIILAGGDGSRLREITRLICDSDAPKQFCAVLGQSSLLDQTRRRVASLIAPQRTAIVVNRIHRRFYEPEVGALSPSLLVEQSANRGTAPAIYYGLRRLMHLGSNAILGIFPSDHFVDNDRQFMAHVEDAMRAVEDVPSRTVVLGIAPRSPETSYGWIEPSSSASLSRPGLFAVRRFWEKPRPELAARLWREHCLWNSFVIVGRADRLEQLIARALPRMASGFNAAFSLSPGEWQDAIDDLYQGLPSLGFSGEVLAGCSADLMVQRVDNVGWNDLGEPDRVLQTLRATGCEPGWVKRFVYEVGSGAHSVLLRRPAASPGRA